MVATATSFLEVHNEDAEVAAALWRPAALSHLAASLSGYTVLVRRGSFIMPLASAAGFLRF